MKGMNRKRSKTASPRRIPRPEYPRPQFERAEWINLNGPWSYCFDFGVSGMDRRLFERKGFDGRIIVPFCPESELSGVGHRDFIQAMWYHRRIAVPAGWAGRDVLLNFGGVDYECELFVDGKPAGAHFGGTVSFSFDITAFVRPGGAHDIVLRVADNMRAARQPCGKQNWWGYWSSGCVYTRTTGIWQTVWLEPVDRRGLKDVHIVPDLDAGRFVVTPRFRGVERGQTLRAAALAGGKAVARAEGPALDGAPLILPLKKPRTWSPGSPFLYDLALEVADGSGRVVDAVRSYAGMRKIHVEGDRVYLNNKELYQRLVLDQGFYPEGIWTAPSDEALKRDIELAMRAGFNGARLHQKVFEERFHYWADRLGYLTWGESSSWGSDPNDLASARLFLSEWQAIVVRDRNHPSLIAWTPLNETGQVTHPAEHRRFHRDLYALCKDLDPTRPVNDASGYIHAQTDLWTVHNYEQDPGKLAAQLTPDREKGVWRNCPEREAAYGGQPYLVDEFGGIKWIPGNRRAYASDSWGYGDTPRSEEEFYGRLKGQVDAILAREHVRGYCYTQLTDVEQEQNGVYNYDRSDKLDVRRIAAIFGRNPAAPRRTGLARP
ncbi:MAG: beta-glucuronidase [Lentisphaerae bacterium]|nr:beta-glucuronidase [Lentisphaerota bacterium]